MESQPSAVCGAQSGEAVGLEMSSHLHQGSLRGPAGRREGREGGCWGQKVVGEGAVTHSLPPGLLGRPSQTAGPDLAPPPLPLPSQGPSHLGPETRIAWPDCRRLLSPLPTLPASGARVTNETLSLSCLKQSLPLP